MKDDKQINLQTPYEIKSPTCTRKHLNINITDTGKGNNRRWQATDGQREQRANSAGRFRHGSPRKYTSRVNPSTSLQNAVKNKVYRLHRKTPECQHYRYRQGQQPALASPRRTARATSDSAGRFRHGCTRKLLPSGKPAGGCGHRLNAVSHPSGCFLILSLRRGYFCGVGAVFRIRISFRSPAVGRV